MPAAPRPRRPTVKRYDSTNRRRAPGREPPYLQKPGRSRLRLGEHRLLIDHGRGQLGEVVAIALVQALLRDLHRRLGSPLSLDGRGERIGVGDDGVQGVGHILVGLQHRILVLRRGLLERLFGRALGVPERAALKDGLGDIADQRPERTAGSEQLRELRRRAAHRAGDVELRQHGGDGRADVRIRRAHGFFRGADVGPLLDDFRGQRKRQLGGQLSELSSNVSGTSWSGRLPASSRIKSRFCSNCFCSGGSCARAWASSSS